MRVTDIRKGDIITYRSGKTNNVNNPANYWLYFNNDFKNRDYHSLDIIKIQRYVKRLWFYKLKTIYKRGGLN